MKHSGKTPLLRARNLERELGVSKIYLKLEGANPTHHKMARIGEVLVKDAAMHGKRTIWVDGSEPYITAIRHFARLEGIAVRCPRFRRESWKKRLFDVEELIDFRPEDGSDRFAILSRHLDPDTEYLAMEGYTQEHIVLMALEDITEEILERQSGLDTIYTQSYFGFTRNSMYNVLLNEWIERELPFPSIRCGVSWADSATRDGVNDTMAYLKHDATLFRTAKEKERQSYGTSIEVDDVELDRASRMLRHKEHIQLSKENAHPFAAFLQDLKHGRIEDGIHVLVLNDARSRVAIRQADAVDEVEFERIFGYIQSYLAQYADPEIEVKDALRNALEKGYVLLAEQNEENQGVCVVVSTQFEHFIPTYHLAYIGTDRTRKGRGIGTELIKRAIDITGGNLSLHVDLDNKNAKKLYEKMGFVHTYNQMIHRPQ
jgi:threonine synthase